MTRLYFSYAPDDRSPVQRLQDALAERGFTVCPDTDSDAASRKADQEESISSCDSLLLIWSGNSAGSPVVEAEWTAAFKLGKTVVPCLLDDTPLPQSLSGANRISLADLEQAVPQIARTITGAESKSGPVDPAGLDTEIGETASELHLIDETVVDALAKGHRRRDSSPRRPVASGSGLFEPGDEIGHRYRVFSLLGRGGMGAVYHVHDRELDRDVALKVIRSDLAQDPIILERFKREIQLSSEVTHKNVLRVFDLGESDGVKFLTMQYVAGEDLAGLIKREGRLPLSKLLSIFRQICQGLAAAHEKGVIHRDLKPQNIMIDELGTVYLTDFGMAKAHDQSSLTQTGVVVGTPFYMSPEQVKGEPVTKRADIFSLGVILYELSTGELPFTGESAYEVMVQRLHRAPKPAVELNPELPSYLQKIMQRCMETDLSLRYETMEEILADLESASVRTSIWYEIRRRRLPRAALVVAAVLLLVGTGWWVYRQVGLRGPETKTVEAAIPVLGVVPFINRSEDAGLTWYGEGIARLVMDSLAQSRHVRVVSAATIDSLRKASPDSASFARSAAAGGIGFILSGEIIPGPGGLSVSARLTETGTGSDVAARRIDGLGRESLIRASDQVAMAVKKGLGVPTTEGVDAFAADFATRNPEAYELYLDGLHALVDYKYPEAERAFAAALGKAPDYTMARYRLAHIQAITGRTEEALAQIRRAVTEATRLSDREARYVRAAEAYFSRRYDEAIEAYRDLIRNYPYEIEARQILGYLFLESGREKEALEPLLEISRLEPENRITWSMLGETYLTLKDLNQAMLSLRRYVELEPGSANGHQTLGDAYRAQGEFDLAAGEYAKALEIDPGFHFSTVSQAVLDVLRGQREEAARRLSALVSDTRALQRHRIDAAFELAFVLRSEGRFRDAARVLESLEKQIAAEKVREALGLAVRGNCLMELGDLKQAARMIDLSVRRSPGVPTRYLFTRGLLELRERRLDAVRRTAAELVEGVSPTEQNLKAQKAAAYLRGLAFLAEGDAEQASAELSRSVALLGTEYGVYHLGLGRAYLKLGRLPEAMAAAKQASAPLDPFEPRLELELDRTRAILLLAEVQNAMGRQAQASDEARRFLRAWPRADSGLGEVAEARKLAR